MNTFVFPSIFGALDTFPSDTGPLDDAISVRFLLVLAGLDGRRLRAKEKKQTMGGFGPGRVLLLSVLCRKKAHFGVDFVSWR